MVEWCPKCNAQLPPGLEECPSCGARLHAKSNDELSCRDILWMTAMIVSFAVVGMLVIMGVLWLIFLH